MTHGNGFRDRLESVIPYVMPAIGGLLGVIWVNLYPMQFYNPMVWIPLGVFLGWLAARGVLRLMNWWS